MCLGVSSFRKKKKGDVMSQKNLVSDWERGEERDSACQILDKMRERERERE